MSRLNHWTALRQRKISRRTMLGASAKAGVGAAGLALVGCGDDDDDAAPAAVDTSAIDAAAGDASAAASAAGEASAAASEASAAASEAAAAASQAADAAADAAALAAEAAESEDAANAAAAAEAAAAAAAQAADAAGAAGDAAAAAVADAAAQAAEAAAQAARDAAAAVEAGTATAEAAQAAIDAAAEAAAAAAAAAGEASAAAGAAAATAQETAEAAAETAAAAVAAAEEAADAAREAAESAAMAAEDEPAATSGPVYGGKIVRTAKIGIEEGWNPARTTSGIAEHNFLQYIYDYVLGFTADNGSAKAELAESWETPDNVTYLFNFAPGRALFQDGAPVDANAMQANMEFRQTDEEASLNARTNSGLANAASFEAVDDVTWRMVNNEPVGPTLAAFWTPGLSGSLISPNAFETAHEHPVGAGPARHLEYRVGEYWLGEKWDGYWDNEHVYADQLETRIVPDDNNAWAQYLDGEVSYQRVAGAMTDELAAELEADGFQARRGIDFAWSAQWFNINPASEGFNMFRDPRLRWAIGLSVDRDVVNDLAENGQGKPSVCNTSTESWAIREGANYYDPPDLAKAAQLRDAAGFGDDNPVTGTMLSFTESRALRGATAVFSQLQQNGWSGLNFLEGAQAPILDLYRSGIDWITASFPWDSPFDPDATMSPSIELIFKNWLYGSPEGGSGTGRASLADYPNDQVLQGIAETEAYTTAATKFASQEDRIEPYDKAFASSGDGHSWSDPDIQGHRWTYHWIQHSVAYGAQGNLGGFQLRPVDGQTASSSGGHGYKGLWFNA